VLYESETEGLSLEFQKTHQSTVEGIICNVILAHFGLFAQYFQGAFQQSFIEFVGRINSRDFLAESGG
jgi:uncharacterized membrane protein